MNKQTNDDQENTGEEREHGAELRQLLLLTARCKMVRWPNFDGLPAWLLVLPVLLLPVTLFRGLEECQAQCQVMPSCQFAHYGWDHARSWCSLLAICASGTLDDGPAPACGSTGDNGVKTYQWKPKGGVDVRTSASADAKFDL